LLNKDKSEKEVKTKCIGIWLTGVYTDGNVGDGKAESRGKMDGKFVGTQGVITDLSELKQLYSALKMSQEEKSLLAKKSEHLHNILETLTNPLFVVDTNLDYIFANKTYLMGVGLDSSEELLGRKLHEFSSEESIKEFNEYFNGMLDTNTNTGYAFSVVVEEETKFFYRNMNPIKDKDGKIVAVSVEDMPASKGIDLLIPICANCNDIREGEEWVGADVFFTKHTTIKFSHSICPTCYNELYGPILNKKE